MLTALLLVAVALGFWWKRAGHAAPHLPGLLLMKQQYPGERCSHRLLLCPALKGHHVPRTSHSASGSTPVLTYRQRENLTACSDEICGLASGKQNLVSHISVPADDRKVISLLLQVIFVLSLTCTLSLKSLCLLRLHLDVHLLPHWGWWQQLLSQMLPTCLWRPLLPSPFLFREWSLCDAA